MLLCKQANFKHIVEFSTGTFHTLSDHSPLSFAICCKNLQENTSSSVDVSCVHCRVECKNVSWKDEEKDNINQEIHSHMDLFNTIVDRELNNQEQVDACVDDICNALNEIVLPKCHTKIVHSFKENVDQNKKHVKRDDKPWFNDECRKKYSDYRAALYVFNKDKSAENRNVLLQKKSQYKRTERILKSRYKRQEGNMIESLRSSNPKQFYKYFSKRKIRSAATNIGFDNFFTHFKNLSEQPMSDTEDILEHSDIEPAVFEELDNDISVEEIRDCIHGLKRNKSCNEDYILNELFIDCGETILSVLHKIFNAIFRSGFFPQSWSKASIVPVFKKGNVNDTNNYRGISLVSCMGKLFTSVLNKRLLNWDKVNSIITDAQFGFRPGFGTVDAIFVLQSLINKYLRKKGGRLYCCFIDYRKAFDFVNRSKLWIKLTKTGIQGKMLKIIKSLYENIKCCVKYQGFLSEYFGSKIGLFQGEILSPILYSLYVNDFEMHLLKENCTSIEINLINLFLIMYADDTVLLAETPENLQCILNSLYNYCQEWNLTVNTDKTKIMVFRNGGRLKDNEKWVYNNCELEIVDEFNYLGLLLNYNGKFTKAQQQLADQGRKALFSISSKLNNFFFNIETKCSVFDTYVNSILSYASEVWGFHKGSDIEKVHLMFCKRILGVKKNVSNKLVYFELGRLPCHIFRKIRAMKYWLKLRNTDNCILKTCYEEMVNENDKWIENIRLELDILGLAFLWFTAYDEKSAFKIIEQRMKDVYIQEMRSEIDTMAKCNFYKFLVNRHCLQFYLTKPLPVKTREIITKFRISGHNLNIEKGRYVNVDRNDRKCSLCNMNEIEDEYHFILQCPIYEISRKRHIKKYYYQNSSVYKLLQLLSTENVKELRELGKFLIEANLIRDTLI